MHPRVKTAPLRVLALLDGQSLHYQALTFVFLRLCSQDAQRKQILNQLKSLSYLGLPGSLLSLTSPHPIPIAWLYMQLATFWLLLSDAVSANG